MLKIFRRLLLLLRDMRSVDISHHAAFMRLARASSCRQRDRVGHWELMRQDSIYYAVLLACCVVVCGAFIGMLVAMIATG